MSAAVQPPDTVMESAPFDPELLKRFFDLLHIPVRKGALKQACARIQVPDQEIVPPLQRMAALIKNLQLYGVQAALLRFGRFDQRKLPVLIFFEGQWQLLEKSAEGLQLTAADGSIRQCREEALGEAFLLWLSHPEKRKEAGAFSANNRARQLVFRELFRSKAWLFDVAVATLIINLLAVSTSIYAMQVYDRVVPTLAWATLTTLVGGMAIVLCLDWLLKTLRARILDSLSCAVDRAVSQQVYEHLLKLRLDLMPRSLGTLAAQVGGLDAARQFFSSGVIFALVDMPFALMFIFFIACVGGKVAWVYTALLPVALCLGFFTQLQLRRLIRKQIMRSNERQGLLVDTIRGAETIRAGSADWRFADQWQEITATISRYNVRQKATSTFSIVSTGTLSSLAYICAVVVGVYQIEAGNLSMGGLIACSILGGRVIGPVARSVQYLVQWQNVSHSLDMVNQLLLIERERPAGKELFMPTAAMESLELGNVKFAYPNSPVHHLQIPAFRAVKGERIAIVGPVGSGKSTLLKILAGIYKPAEGRIRLGNADLWETEPDIIAEQVGYLPQTVHLFKGTLRSNLTLFGNAGDDELLEVCSLLGIDKIVENSPRNMDLEISEGGEGLSGGQKQLVGLARILLARPRIWLLDEPTSSLDHETEIRALQAIEQRLRPDDILLISTHKSMLVSRLAKRMVAMQRGEVHLDGPIESVLARMRAPQRQPGGEISLSAAIGNSKRGLNVI